MYKELVSIENLVRWIGPRRRSGPFKRKETLALARYVCQNYKTETPLLLLKKEAHSLLEALLAGRYDWPYRYQLHEDHQDPGFYQVPFILRYHPCNILATILFRDTLAELNGSSNPSITTAKLDWIRHFKLNKRLVVTCRHVDNSTATGALARLTDCERTVYSPQEW